MRIEVVPIPEAEYEAFLRLWQLYLYDFSELDGNDLRDDGTFGALTDLGDYWRDPRKHPFFVRADGRLAGFALIHRRGRLADDPDVTRMAEFFIVRKYRRRGLGARVAASLFDRFPGRWEVWEIAENAAAQAFWRRVIGGYTGGRYEEVIAGGRPVQVFDTADRLIPRAAGTAP
jgi:predicted acetyltransferase